MERSISDSMTHEHCAMADSESNFEVGKTKTASVTTRRGLALTLTPTRTLTSHLSPLTLTLTQVGNYGTVTTTRTEWLFVTDPINGLKALNLNLNRTLILALALWPQPYSSSLIAPAL